MLPQKPPHVNPQIIPFRDPNDADARLREKAERLAMTVAEFVVAAENRWNVKYGLFHVHQGGVGMVECVTPYEYPDSAPWVHLLPVGWRTTPQGARRTYLVRKAAPHYGAADWTESDNMREWLTAGREDTGGVMTEPMP